MKYIINCDGGSRGNPGPAATGYVIKDESGQIIHQEGQTIGDKTNNQAEYQAVIFAMEKALELEATELHFNLDSELVVKQLKGEYKVKNPELAQQFLKIWNMQSKFKKVEYKHVYREQNSEADALVNKALDER